MVLQRGADGKILRNGNALVRYVDTCCCDGMMAEPTCCYNDNCQVVSCGDPSVVGSVAGCDPCNLNFCGYCKTTEPTSVSIPTFNFPEDTQTAYPLCQYVEHETVDLSLTLRGTVFFGNTFNAENIYTMIRPGNPESQYGDIRASVGNAAGANTSGFTITFPGGNFSDFTFDRYQDGTTFEIDVQSSAVITMTPLDLDTCSQTETTVLTWSYRVLITRPNGETIEAEDDNTVSRTITINYNECADGEAFHRARLTTQFGGTFDTATEGTVASSQRTWTNLGPTCVLP